MSNDTLEQEVHDIRKDMEELQKEVGDLHTDVRILLTQITKYKGFVGGVVFTFSCIIAALGAWFGYKH